MPRKQPHPQSIIDVESCSFDDSGYRSANGDLWYASTLYKAAEEQNCKRFRLPLMHVDLAWCRWRDMNRIYDMAYVVKRVNAADLKHPILMGPYGGIMDGAHRLVKAIVEGRRWIWCVRLKELPEPDKKGGCDGQKADNES